MKSSSNVIYYFIIELPIMLLTEMWIKTTAQVIVWPSHVAAHAVSTSSVTCTVATQLLTQSNSGLLIEIWINQSI